MITRRTLLSTAAAVPAAGIMPSLLSTANAQAQTPRRGGTLNVGVVSDPVTLDLTLNLTKVIMNIQLKPNQEQFIQKQLKSGRFNNSEQVIDTAFYLLEILDQDYLQWVEETRQKIDVAIAELDNGEGLDGEKVINDILEKFKKAQQK